MVKHRERVSKNKKYLEGIRLKPRFYCPILQTRSNGDLIFVRALEYNSLWLHTAKEGIDLWPVTDCILRRKKTALVQDGSS